MSEDRGQRTEDRGQRTEDRRQRSEDRGQKTEVRGQKTEVRGQKTEALEFGIGNAEGKDCRFVWFSPRNAQLVTRNRNREPAIRDEDHLKQKGHPLLYKRDALF